ncbi:MAG: hypothetical protein LBS09_01205 [Bacteroidales bacterium]|jgi:hypothetical protein|nr:hypothetical protein [Bacteroidales bacterium]
MKYIPSIFLLSVFLAAFSCEAAAQCKPFVKSSCIPVLSPYIHDGSYQAAIMGEGEEAEIYKTVFSGQLYRLYVCVAPTIPAVEFEVFDAYGKILLFDSRKNGNVRQWDFKSEASQQIKIKVKIPVGKGETPVEGCVGVFFGLKER